MRWKRFPAAILVLCLLLSGCSSASADSTQAAPGGGVTRIRPAVEDPAPGADSPGTPYVAPPFQSSAFHADKAAGNDGALIDLSGLASGYVAVACTADVRVKFQVMKDETYTYDLASDGSPSIFPLQMGDGDYTFRVLKNIADSKYAILYSTQAEVRLENEFAPYLRPSNYVNYSQSSACVQKAAELATTAGDELGLVSAVYTYICQNVVYDYDKVDSLPNGYLPDLEEIYRSGKGICMDYAAMGAAMLRSQGIPTKVVFGYVSPNGLYHAWNMFYTEKTGWVAVEFQVTGKRWARLDLTFSANGTNADYIGDGSNYADTYYY